MNVIAPIFTEPGKGAYRQAIYWPFRDMSLFGRGTVLTPVIKGDKNVYQIPLKPAFWNVMRFKLDNDIVLS